MVGGGRPAGATNGGPGASNRTVILVAIGFVALMAVAVAWLLTNRPEPGERTTLVCPDGPEIQTFEEPPPMRLEEGVDYAAVVTTDRGAFTIDLLEDAAPVTVNNFVFLARSGFYDCTTFHRVIPEFVVQGGDPSGDGTGGPGYTIPDELPEEGAYEIGSVAMANAGPDTGGSQFFIVTGPNGAALPPAYPLFGEVTDGMAVVEDIEALGTPAGTPTDEVFMTSVEVVER